MRILPKNELDELIQGSIEILGRNRSNTIGKLVVLPPIGEATVIGDIHGDLKSLKKIMARARGEGPRKNRYLICLGDYIDRGPHQVEVLTTVLTHLRKHPDQVILLRGNHEGPQDLKVSPHDFPSQLKQHYGYEWRTLSTLFQELFDSMFTACLIRGKALLLHGGIPTTAETMNDIAYAHETHPENSFLEEILWNDPSTIPGEQPSFRGVGKMYGMNVAERFLDKSDVRFLIRGHENQEDGYFFNSNRILTLFSCKIPSYRNKHCAFLKTPLNIEFTKTNLIKHINLLFFTITISIVV